MSITSDSLRLHNIETPITSIEHSRAPAPPEVRRLLGAVALEGEPRTLFQRVIAEGSDLEIGEAWRFRQVMHEEIVGKIRHVNESRGRNPDLYLVDPRRVSRGMEDFNNVFEIWSPRVSTARLETVLQEFLTEHVATAEQERRRYPQINLLLQLRAELQEKTTPEAATTANELLAVYGWAAGNEFATKRLELMRHTENIDRLSIVPAPERE